MYKLSGQTSDFVSYSEVSRTNFSDYVTAFSQQFNKMLNKGLMGSKDWSDLLLCAQNHYFLACIRPFDYHDMRDYGIGHIAVSDSILKFCKEK